MQIAEKRREVKGKGETERYIHLNAEFQITARRDNKAFFSDQYKEIEENNRMGGTRDLFKKIRDTKGTFREISQQDSKVVITLTLHIALDWFQSTFLDFPRGPVFKSLGSQCRGDRFDPWSGNIY